ncbi:tetratricopeptide repeat protein [Propionivibrio dicarboxylicus]|uniref:Sel1 repeat-containing protein n=1 Tax=Propionivibrio dicarboxylicus TaxID=83767 RepID=A0A1G8N423_9RHOO|nr:tetratricopeptide repeat protein [Propionivibrio dicarboxylicus]SDI74942.1 Sel1 repeat-containing protein [Propionivibrio dicarboxylicus]
MLVDFLKNRTCMSLSIFMFISAAIGIWTIVHASACRIIPGEYGISAPENRGSENIRRLAMIVTGDNSIPNALPQELASDIERSSARFSEAFAWYKAATDRGNVLATNNLGICYQEGLGVDRDYTEALRLYRVANEHGSALAAGNIGVMYRDGLGVARDYAEAMRWFRAAAERGSASAANNLGLIFRDGLGVRKDLSEADHWFRIARDRGNREAFRNMLLGYAEMFALAENWPNR